MSDGTTKPWQECHDQAAAARGKVFELLRQHANYRAGTLNLIASENVISPTVAAALQGDLEGRYADYIGLDLHARKYRGGRYVVELEELCTELVCRVFAAETCELRALSGHVAGNAVLGGLCPPGARVLEISQEGGGHRLATKLAQAPLVDLSVAFLPFDPHAFNVHVEAAVHKIVEFKPHLVILGSSSFLHPHPVAQLRTACDRVGAILVYDASHVMGLVAAKRFQRPLAEGVDLVFGSTHKTLFGPQGGLIFGSRELVDKASSALYPPLVTNHHLARLPALSVALCEHLEFGQSYAEAVIANASRFAEELAKAGCHVVGGGTESHTVLVATPGQSGADAARNLEQSGVIVNGSRLPQELGGEGIRFGLQELTRRGAQITQATEAARIVTDALNGSNVANSAHELATSLPGIAFTWSTS